MRAATLSSCLVACSLFTANAQAGESGYSYRLAAWGIAVEDPSGAVIGGVPIDGGARAMALSGSRLYVARGTSGVVIINTAEPAAPGIERWFADPLSVYSVEIANQRLDLILADHSVVSYDISEPANEPIPLGSPTGFRSASPRDVPPELPAPASTHQDQALTRLTVGARLQWSLLDYYGAFLGDFGIEHRFASGLLLGFELPHGFDFTPHYGGYGVYGRFRVGYARPSFAIAFGVETGFPSVIPTLGPSFRIGRLDATYVEAWLYFLTIAPFPGDVGLRVSTPVGPKWRVQLTFANESTLGFAIYSRPYVLVGGQYALRGDGNAGTSLIHFGLGLTFPVAAAGIPGPVLQIGYERRF